MKLLAQACWRYGDFLEAVAEAFGDRPWTAADLRRAGICLPAGKGLKYFHLSDAIVPVLKKREGSTWKLSEKYLQRGRRAA